MVKYKFEIKINIGNFQNVLYGVDDCDSFKQAEVIVSEHIKSLDIDIDKHVKDCFRYVKL